MKKLVIILAIASLLVVVGCGKAAKTTDDNTPIKLETEKQKASYAVGYQTGMNMKTFVDEVDFDIVLRGLKDAATGKDSIIPPQEVQPTMRKFYTALRKKQQEKRKVEGEKNKAEGEAFLAENAKREGVKVTDSGLQYEVITEGTGPKPTLDDTVEVHYKGTLLDGTEFDSSYKRGEPAVFPLKRVIKAWQEGVQLMPVGSKYKLYCPADIAYGDRGTRNIGANAVLTFEVELLSIKAPEEKKEPVAGKAAPNPAKK